MIRACLTCNGDWSHAGVIEPISLEPADVRRWVGWELAMLIEGHCHQIVDTDALSDPQRAEWERQVTDDGAGLRDPHKSFFIPSWLLSGDERVGTFAIQSNVLGWADICVASLYVRPDHRRRGIATRALDATYDATRQAGADGMRIPTSWCWPQAVRFYAHRGLWAHNWKHSLVFSRRAALWPYRVDIEGRAARFSITRDGTETPLIEALMREKCSIGRNCRHTPRWRRGHHGCLTTRRHARGPLGAGRLAAHSLN
jgi:GNAT superfamily N-acetyltransferase